MPRAAVTYGANALTEYANPDAFNASRQGDSC